MFEVEEGAFVGDFLADLHDGAPGVGCEGFGAVGTLVVGYYVFDFEGLLEDRALEGFLLDCDFYFHSPRVGFRPYEIGVDDSDFG